MTPPAGSLRGLQRQIHTFLDWVGPDARMPVAQSWNAPGAVLTGRLRALATTLASGRGLTAGTAGRAVGSDAAALQRALRDLQHWLEGSPVPTPYDGLPLTQVQDRFRRLGVLAGRLRERIGDNGRTRRVITDGVHLERETTRRPGPGSADRWLGWGEWKSTAAGSVKPSTPETGV